MRRQRYYPTSIAKQVTWLTNFAATLPPKVTLLGLDTAKADAVVAGCKFAAYGLNEWLTGARGLGPASTSAIDLLLSGEGPDPVVLPTFTAPPLPAGVAAVPPGVLPRLFDLVAEIKESDAYTDIIGAELGIIGPEDAAEHAAPEVKEQVVDGVGGGKAVRFTFKKFGHMGVIGECSINGGAMTFLAIDTESPYVDERPLAVAGTPETRVYRWRFWDKGTPNGEWTDLITVTVGV